MDKGVTTRGGRPRKRILWRDDEEWCPWGHPQVVCRVIRVDAGGHRHSECAVRRIEEAEARQKEGVRPSPSFRRTREELYVRLGKYGSTYENSSRKYTLNLKCGHANYQKTTNFSIFDDMYCYKCQAWSPINSFISPKGQETHRPT